MSTEIAHFELEQCSRSAQSGGSEVGAVPLPANGKMGNHNNNTNGSAADGEPVQNGVQEAGDGRQRHKSSTAGEYVWSEQNRLGVGSFGAVFKGEHVQSGTAVAVKRIDAGTAINMIEVESIHAVANRCPYIVDYLAVFNEPQATFVVMQLLDVDLATVIDRHQQLGSRNLDTIAEHIAKGYREVARAGIVHRDIKPNNILLYIRSGDGAEPPPAAAAGTSNGAHTDGQGDVAPAENGDDRQEQENGGGAPETNGGGDEREPLIYRAMISDFGSSKAGLVRKASACVVGTPLYMAPEVGANMVSQSSYDHSVDMWSIGVVLYECIIGEAPFDERKLCRLFLSAAGNSTGGYVPPAFEQRPGVAEKYHKVVPKLLDIDPKRRPTAEQFHDYLIDGGELEEEPSAVRSRHSHSRLTASRQNSSTGSAAKLADGNGNGKRGSFLKFLPRMKEKRASEPVFPGSEGGAQCAIRVHSDSAKSGEGGGAVKEARSDSAESAHSGGDRPLKIDMGRRKDSTRSSTASIKRTFVRLFSCASSHSGGAELDRVDDMEAEEGAAESNEVAAEVSDGQQHASIPEEK